MEEKKRSRIRYKLSYPDGKEKVVDLGDNQNEARFVEYCAEMNVAVDRIAE